VVLFSDTGAGAGTFTGRNRRRAIDYAPNVIGIGSVVNGKYRLTRLLGDGGMGSVYEAQHTVLGTRVAIKVLHPELARRTGLVERFLQEARVAAQIRSPHVVHVTDVDRTPDGQAYIVMDLLEGEPLSSVLERQHKLPVATACLYALQILEALEAAHALGVIHRDLKPENVFVTFVAGKPALKLIDFGIAKARRADQQQKNLTVAGVVMGTAEYMSPEQARSADKVDARADIYAAGVMLYEMIAGTRPVSGEDARIIAFKVEQGDIIPLVRVAPDVPREIAGLVHRAMAARPELRFATATEMRLAIEKARRVGTAVLGAPAMMSAPPGFTTAAGMQQSPTAAATGGEGPESVPVHTMRAPPIASALAPAAFGGAAVPAGPSPGDGRPARHRRNAPLVAAVAIPVLLGAGVVGVLAATGTWASSPTATVPLSTPRIDRDEEAAAGLPGTAATTRPISDVPKLVPTRPATTPVAPHALPSARPTASAVADAASPPPFFLPPTLPSALPPFPSVLPFPTNFPMPFPSILPAWPPTLPSSGPAPNQAPAPGGPGY
jgi:serine/threonine protein kinase